MPMIDFPSEFRHRYIKDFPMVSWKGSAFFPIDIFRENSKYCVEGFVIDSKTCKKVKTTVPYNEEDFLLQFPDIGWLNVDSRTCIYFSINPIRQWRFALTQKTCNVFNPLHLEYKELKYPTVTPSLIWINRLKGKRIANTLWNRKYYSIKKAFDLLVVNKTHLAAAFSKDFALVAHKDKKYPTLYYKRYAIGYVYDRSTVHIPEHLSFMKEALQEYFLSVEEVYEHYVP